MTAWLKTYYRFESDEADFGGKIGQCYTSG